MNRLFCGRAVLCALALVLFATPALLAQDAKPPKLIAKVEGISEYQLDNGMRVLLFPDSSSAKVTVNLTVLVGSRHEGYGETGMAHLLEHMVFKGTPMHPDVPKAIRDHGAGREFNGTTWVDRTNYYESMPATDENLEFGIKLEADRMMNSFIKREDLLKEFSVVRSEFERGENDPGNILSQRMMATAYEWHNYGKSTIGNRSDIERVPIENLQAFYKKFYQPDNAVLVVAGKFDEKKALAYATKYFGSIPAPKRKLDKTYTEEPAQDGEREVTLRRVGDVGVVGVIYHVPAGAHPDFAAVEVLNHILTSEPSGRLYKALVLSKKATSISGFAAAWHDPGVIELMAQVDPKGDLNDVRRTMLEVLENLHKEKITQEEVDRAKNSFRNRREELMKDPSRVAISLSDWISKGDWRLFFLHRDRINKVTADDVRNVAEKYLQQPNRTVGVYIPSKQVTRTPVPETPDVAELLKDYKGGEAVAAGEFFDPTPENIQKRVKFTDLPSGIKVALLPKKTRGEKVVAQLTLRFGNEKSLNSYNTAADFLGEMMKRGTKKLSRQQINDKLDSLGARLSASSDLGVVTFTIVADREKLPKVLEILNDILRQPAFPAEEFDVLKREQRDQLTKGLTEPTALAFIDLRRRLHQYKPDNIRYTPTLQESIERLDKLTLDDVKKLYAEQLGGTTGELVLVGDYDDGVLKQIAGMLEGWKSAIPYERIAKPANLSAKGQQHVILTPDKANAVYAAGELFGLMDTDPEYPALVMADYVLGSGTLSSRLGTRVRQKEGLSYGIRSRFNASAKDKAGSFLVFAICNPMNMEKVDAAIADELNKFLKDGVEPTELEEAIKAYLGGQKTTRANDGALAAILSSLLEEGRTFEYYIDQEKKIAALKPEDVNKAAKKTFDPKRLVIIKAGDFKKKSE
ncbi:MAG: M16 family metallopeptidase [Gemmataceae bacterium]